MTVPTLTTYRVDGNYYLLVRREDGAQTAVLVDHETMADAVDQFECTKQLPTSDIYAVPVKRYLRTVSCQGDLSELMPHRILSKDLYERIVVRKEPVHLLRSTQVVQSISGTVKQLTFALPAWQRGLSSRLAKDPRVTMFSTGQELFVWTTADTDVPYDVRNDVFGIADLCLTHTRTDLLEIQRVRENPALWCIETSAGPIVVDVEGLRSTERPLPVATHPDGRRYTWRGGHVYLGSERLETE